MNSPGFGRRVVQTDTRALMVVPDAPPERRADLTGREDLKERIRSILMSRIDPANAGRMPRARLRAEVGLLVSAIATDEKVQLNEVEETALAAELTDDMVGLGRSNHCSKMTRSPTFSSMVPMTFTSSGTVNWKRPPLGFAMASMSSTLRSVSRARLADVLTRRARWWMPASRMAAASTS